MVPPPRQPDSRTRPGPPSAVLRFWGTRGSVPSPGPSTAGYGGNTPCLDLQADGRRYIFDAGTGIRLLGQRILETGSNLETTLFLTHFHWDHIQGFPFFAPLYRPESVLRILGPMQRDIDIRSVFAGQMGPIYFPIPFSAIAARTRFEHLNEGEWTDGTVRVEALRVRHPSFTVGYRILVGDRCIVYAPDNELDGEDYGVGPGWHRRLAHFLRDADLLIHDSMYTTVEYESRRGWGHSTFDQCLDLAVDTGARRLLLFHHAPERSDEALDHEVERTRERAARSGSAVDIAAAREGDEHIL